MEQKSFFGKTITLDRSRDSLLSQFSMDTLNDRYLLEGEGAQDMFGRVASAFADGSEHAQRIYDYMSKLWFLGATPVLSNGGAGRGLPISCFLNAAEDSLQGIVGLWNENVWLASNGGGIGSYWGNLRSIGEKVTKAGKTSGIIPFIKVMDSQTLAISQGSLRRGSAAVYLDISHPEIEEFIEIRKPTGGDPNRRTLNLHHGVMVTDKFMHAVEKNLDFDLVSPKGGAVVRTVSARSLWIKMLTARVETGEPYIVFKDTVNRAIPEHHKLSGLTVQQSNLCSEITLPTGIDHRGNDRTAVCCLSSVNVENYDQWKDEELFIEDILRFLDNVLQNFIDTAPDSMSKAKYAASMERSVGLGVMGLHSFFQSKGIPFEGAMAKVWNKKIFSDIKDKCDAANAKLGEERGACPDADEHGICLRFSNCTAVAPTASISIIANSASPGIEPYVANAFTHKTLAGSHLVKNRFLKKVLEGHDKDKQEVWSSIIKQNGSVQHLEFLSDIERDVFKTARELDQRWVVMLAGDRAPFIDQAQSVNLFLAADVHKKDLHKIHMDAWKSGVKSLYYCRSESIQRADVSAVKRERMDEAEAVNPNNGEECLACQ